MYSILKRFLFLFNPEKVHYFALKSLKTLLKISWARSLTNHLFTINDPILEKTIWNLKFPNPVGLAAGFDKNGQYIDEIACLGFGFIEIGTLTPRSQEGNPIPRLFRLPNQNAIINRMGFNNDGLDQAIKNLKGRKNKDILIGGNIGKNKNTDNVDAWKDYLENWEKLYDYVDYFVVNVSSPNTPNLRELQEKEPLKKILSALKTNALEKNRNKPILLKISPDLSFTQLDDIIEIILSLGLDGVVATNTTLDRSLVPENETYRNEDGGLSGAPLGDRSTELIRYIHNKGGGKFPIIGVGGILSAQDALDKISAGASLVQIYTGFVFKGPSLVKEINKALVKNLTDQLKY